MATFYKYTIEYIEDRKISPAFTKGIIDEIKNDPENESVADVWDDNTANHPGEYLAVFLLTVINPGVLAWIDEIIPDHHARQAFDVGDTAMPRKNK